MDDIKFFMSFMEADDPPDAAMVADNSPPPDVPEDNGGGMAPDDMPDMGDGAGDPPDFGGDDTSMDDGGDGSPPDFGDDEGGFGDEEGATDEEGGEDQKEPMDLDDKVSAIMNANLYTRFLTMLTNIEAQMSQMKSNADIVYTLSPDASDMYNKYKQLDDNIRLYLNNSFIDENYSKNLLFFNKCLNLLKLLNDSFSSYVNKGIREQK